MPSTIVTMFSRSAAICLVLLALLVAWSQPLTPHWFLAASIGYALALAAYPLAWMLALPAVIAVADLTPWAGLRAWGELDIFVALTLASGLWRGDFQGAWSVFAQRRSLIALLVLSVVAVLQGSVFATTYSASASEFSHYFGPYGVLRCSKGLVYALLLYLQFAGQSARETRTAEHFSAGLLLGLISVCLIVLWERLMFTGPIDFSQSYRVTALFSSMHIGGAAVDGFLALTIPAIGIALAVSSSRLVAYASILLLGAAVYAFLVTFSRTNYLAAAAMIAIAFISNRYMHSAAAHEGRSALSTLLVLALLSSIAVPIALGSYARDRMSTASADLAIRLQHWGDVIDSYSAVGGTWVFGHGAGSFPIAKHRLLALRGKPAPDVQLAVDGEESYLRFSRSDSAGIYSVRQRLTPTERGAAVLTLRARTTNDKPQRLIVETCEMNILRASPECAWTGINLNEAPPGQWVEYSRPLSLGHFWRSFFGLTRPVDLMILHRGLSESVDIAEVTVTDDRGKQLISNPGFDGGVAPWYFNDDAHLNWHAKNLFLHIFFETGLLGLIVFGYVLARSIIKLFDRVREGDRFAQMLLVAVTGFLVLGMFDSLIDDPRIGLLFFLVIFIGLGNAGLSTSYAGSAIFPWRIAVIVFSALLLSLILVSVTYLSLSRKQSPLTLFNMAMARADIDWPWLEQALAPEPLPEFPGPENWPSQGALDWPLPAQRYQPDGRPVPANPGSMAGESWLILDTVRVSNMPELRSAMSSATPGTRIVLEPGNYEFKGKMTPVKSAGEPGKPIVLTADEPGTVVLEFLTREGFYLEQPNWVFENLVIRGTCANHGYCEHAFHIIGTAENVVIRNNRISDFNAPIKVNGKPLGEGRVLTPDHGLIEHNTIFNSSPRQTGLPVTFLNINNGNSWRVSANFIADFGKAGGDRISYGAFMKGNSQGGVFERNLIVCYWRHQPGDGIRIGLSLGGGGTGDRFCPGNDCSIEHTSGIIRANVIARCPDDVGIYLNRAAETSVHNNLLPDSLGIDVRFSTSSASIINNVYRGRIRNRDGGTSESSFNLELADCGFLGVLLGSCSDNAHFVDPARGDFRLVPLRTSSAQETLRQQVAGTSVVTVPTRLRTLAQFNSPMVLTVYL